MDDFASGKPDAIREGRGDLLAVNAREIFPDAGVALHLSVPDLWNGILGLKHQPDAFDERGERLRNGTKDSSEEEIGGQIFEGQLVLKHAASTVTVLTTVLLSYSENYDRSQTDLDQEVLGTQALTEGRTPHEVTENGLFRDRFKISQCGCGCCPLVPVSKQELDRILEAITELERGHSRHAEQRSQKRTRRATQTETTSNVKCKIRPRLNTCAREECVGRCDVTNTDRSPQTLPRSQKPLRKLTTKNCASKQSNTRQVTFQREASVVHPRNNFKMWKIQKESFSEAFEVQEKLLATLFQVASIAHSSAGLHNLRIPTYVDVHIIRGVPPGLPKKIGTPMTPSFRRPVSASCDGDLDDDRSRLFGFLVIMNVFVFSITSKSSCSSSTIKPFILTASNSDLFTHAHGVEKPCIVCVPSTSTVSRFLGPAHFEVGQPPGKVRRTVLRWRRGCHVKVEKDFAFQSRVFGGTFADQAPSSRSGPQRQTFADAPRLWCRTWP